MWNVQQQHTEIFEPFEQTARSITCMRLRMIFMLGVVVATAMETATTVDMGNCDTACKDWFGN